MKPQLDELGVSLYAVVKENISTEIQEFRSYFSGDIFIDEKVEIFSLEMKSNFNVVGSFLQVHDCSLPPGF